MRVVLDTNIFISGIFWSGNPYRILKAWGDNKIKLVISVDILHELFRVLDQEFNMPEEEIKDLGRFILENAVIADPRFKLNVIEHKPDNRFLECALVGKAEYIVSGDSHLLELKEYAGIKIVSPAEFIRILKGRP